MKLIAGLGNPGPEYYLTRHNSGFVVVEKIGTTHGAHFSLKKDLFCELAKIRLFGEDLILAKPLTYMNLSGRSMCAVLHWYKISRKDMLVIHDDVSLPLGKIRLQKDGGAGGQHGIESIIECLGSNEFPRLKFGVGPDPGGSDRADYVLSRFPAADQPLLDRSVALAADAAITWLRSGISEAMNKFNGMRLDLPADPVADQVKPPVSEQS